MWPFYKQVTLEIMQKAIRFQITSDSIIKVWFDKPNDPSAYKTYWLGTSGLKMLGDNGFFPAK
jgi:hypothetical protein